MHPAFSQSPIIYAFSLYPASRLKLLTYSLRSPYPPQSNPAILMYSLLTWSSYSFHVFNLLGFVYHMLLTLPFLAYFHPFSLSPLLFSEKTKSFQLHRQDREVTFLPEASSFGPPTYIKGKWGPFWSDQATVLILFTVTECGS